MSKMMSNKIMVLVRSSYVEVRRFVVSLSIYKNLSFDRVEVDQSCTVIQKSHDKHKKERKIITLQEEPHKRKFPEFVTMHEITRVQESATYQFWLTASTKVGEGESTSVITVSPAFKSKSNNIVIREFILWEITLIFFSFLYNLVPARISSFSQKIVTPWKKNITLPCQRVGVPEPKLTWKQKTRNIVSTDRILVSIQNTNHEEEIFILEGP